jgi:hypothetical protein
MRSTALRIALLLVLATLLAGCGGGSSGSSEGGDGSGGGSGGGQEQEQQASGGGDDGEETGEGAAGESKIALGRIAGVNEEAGRFSVEPSSEEQGQEPITFKLAEGGVVTLDGEEAELSAMKKGQAAQVEYVVLGKLNRARVVELLAGETTTG